MDGLSDLLDREIAQPRNWGATTKRQGVGFETRLTISPLGLGGAARDVIRLSSSLVCSHLQAMAVMMPDKRHVEIKRPQMDSKCRNWRRETNGGERGNSKNSADLSHVDYANSSSIETMAVTAYRSKRRHAQRRSAYCWRPL